jgi:hypothetical protein
MQLARAHCQSSLRCIVTVADALVAVMLVEETLVSRKYTKKEKRRKEKTYRKCVCCVWQTARFGYSILNFQAPATSMARSNLDNYAGNTLETQMNAFGDHVARVCAQSLDRKKGRV